MKSRREIRHELVDRVQNEKVQTLYARGDEGLITVLKIRLRQELDGEVYANADYTGVWTIDLPNPPEDRQGEKVASILKRTPDDLEISTEPFK